MAVYSLVMVTTHRDNFHINKLLDSVSLSTNSFAILLLVISQDSEIVYDNNNPGLSIHFIKSPRLGLSEARNIGLNYLLDNNISSEYIMFPDDDSSFDDIFFVNFVNILGSQKSYITPIYNEGTKDLYLGKKYRNNGRVGINRYDLIGSPNQIIQYDMYKQYLSFDNDLGVGAKYGSSEDLDLFIRLNSKGASFFYTDNIYSFHPKKTDKYKDVSLGLIVRRFASYSTGFAVLIFKYNLYLFVPAYLFRTFAAFIIFLFKLDFKLSLAYFIQFFIRIKLLLYFLLNRNKLHSK